MKTPQRRTFKVVSSYLGEVYNVNHLPHLVNATAEVIEKLRKRKRIDAIAFTGTSGAALAYPLSVKMGIPLICIRKEGAASHYYSTYEGVTGIKKYIIVDDCIETGSTVRRIKREVAKRCRSAQLTGVVIYNQEFGGGKTCGGAPIYYVD